MIVNIPMPATAIKVANRTSFIFVLNEVDYTVVMVEKESLQPAAITAVRYFNLRLTHPFALVFSWSWVRIRGEAEK